MRDATATMSAGGAFGGSRGLQPRAPEKGVFPLDHFGECKQVNMMVHAAFMAPARPSPGFNCFADITAVPCLPQGERGRGFKM